MELVDVPTPAPGPRQALGKMTFVLTREELLSRADDVLNAFASGALKLRIDSTFPLAAAAEAHRALESRKTAGKILLAISL